MYDICWLGLLIYYPVAIIRMVRLPERKQFYHAVVFPLPILLLFGAWVMDEANEENFDSIARYLIFISSVIGLGVMAHCFLERKSREQLFQLRLLAASIMLMNPLLLYFPDLYSVMLTMFFFSGILLGFYGNVALRSGKSVGLAYIYSSAIFMVLMPAITYALSGVYADFVDKIVIYRRAPDGMTCHSIASTPVVPPWESVKIPLIFSSLYTGIIMAQGRIMRWLLVRNMRGKGKIPEDYLAIVKSSNPDDGPGKNGEDVDWKEDSNDL